MRMTPGEVKSPQIAVFRYESPPKKPRVHFEVKS